MELPIKIKGIIKDKNYKIDDIGMSDSNVLVFDDMVLKITKDNFETRNEIYNLKFLSELNLGPRLIEVEEKNGELFILMSKVEGKMICDEYYMNNPQESMEMLVKALKIIKDVDISKYKGELNLDIKLKNTQSNIDNNLVDMENVQPTTFGEGGFKDPKELLEWLMKNKKEDNIVLSHGDFTLPNIIVEEDGGIKFIDLGRMGISDIHQDIALCYRSLKHNFEGRYSNKKYKKIDMNEFIIKVENELNIKVDMDKIKYYILLDELF